METIQFFLQYFVTLFVVISPLVIMALFVSMTASYTVAERLQTAKTACKVGGLVLLLCTMTGRKVFEFFGISMGAFYIAGGILLFLIGIDMLRSKDSDAQSEDESGNKAKPREDISITPLGVPLITGPGCITAAIAQQAKATNWAEYIAGLVAVVLVIYAVYLLLSAAARGTKWLTPTVLCLSYRLSGLILAALAVEMIVTGIKSNDLGLWSHGGHDEVRVIVEDASLSE